MRVQACRAHRMRDAATGESPNEAPRPAAA